MTRIVREHYPVAGLPEDLRKGLKLDDCVQVTIEPEPRPDNVATARRRLLLEELYAQARPSFSSLEEIADHIRSIRREWAERSYRYAHDTSARLRPEDADERAW